MDSFPALRDDSPASSNGRRVSPDGRRASPDGRPASPDGPTASSDRCLISEDDCVRIITTPGGCACGNLKMQYAASLLAGARMMCKGVHESLALNVKCLEKAIVETQEAISVTAVVHANEAMHGGAEISQVQGALAGARALRQGVNIIGNASRVSAELAMDHTKEAEHGETPITSEPRPQRSRSPVRRFPARPLFRGMTSGRSLECDINDTSTVKTA